MENKKIKSVLGYCVSCSCWCEGTPGRVRLMVKSGAGSSAAGWDLRKAGLFVALFFFFVSRVLGYIVFVHFLLLT